MEIQRIMALAAQYAGERPERILLSERIGCTVEERRAVATQLELRRALERKLPSWYEAGVYLPTHLSLEQASSEAIARYKCAFVQPTDRLIDLTGGLGVDFWAMSSIAASAIYIEQDERLYAASCHNLLRLGLNTPYSCRSAEALSELSELLPSYKPTLIYVDPARRVDQQRAQRVYAIEDCSPNLHDVVRLIKEQGDPSEPLRLLAKLSPMLDVKHTLRTLPEVTAVHALALGPEVKELLLEIAPWSPRSAGAADERDIPLTAHQIGRSSAPLVFTSTYAEEREPCTLAKSLGAFLYEPSGAVLKLGLYYSIGRRYALQKLHVHTHLYTSDTLVADFPGRVLRIEELIPYQSKHIKSLGKRIAKAQITCRHFPLSAERLRQQLGIGEDHQHTIVGTTLEDGARVLLVCSPVSGATC